MEYNKIWASGRIFTTRNRQHGYIGEGGSATSSASAQLRGHHHAQAAVEARHAEDLFHPATLESVKVQLSSEFLDRNGA